MRMPAILFTLVAGLIGGFWFWLGTPVAMPTSPLAAGEKLFCVSYAPFRGTQNPLSDAAYVSAQQIDEDLARLAATTDCVRTYSTEHGLDQVPAIAGKYGLKVMQGLWLSSNREKSRYQVESTIKLANQYRDVIVAVIVGNEVLLRGEMSATGLEATIREVKARVPAPVTYADVWEFWLQHPALAEAVDFVTIHILPYWEDDPIAAAQGAAHVDSIRRRVVAAFPNKEILIGETGWPTAGRMREGALPSPSSQSRLIHEVLHNAKRGNYRVNVIEAFDQPWKRALEGTVGGYWGLYDDETRQPKFRWGAPISDHPFWKVQAAAGIAFASVVFAAGWFARRKSLTPDRDRRWIGVAVLALAGGALIGWTVENAVIQSLGLPGWLRSLALTAVALISPPLAAAAWMRNVGVPRLAQMLRGEEAPTDGRLVWWLGLTLLGLCTIALTVALGLVFDPRYKDLPFAPLTAAAVPFFLLVLRSPRSVAGYRVAETVFAALLGASVIYFTFNEGFANWQSLWLAGALILLIIALLLPSARSFAAARG
jgi:glucan 1,3-beta-glucosidase